MQFTPVVRRQHFAVIRVVDGFLSEPASTDYAGTNARSLHSVRGHQHVSSSPPPRRPRGVTALACLFAFGTFASGLSFIAVLTPGGFLEPMWRLNPRAHDAFAHMGNWGALLLGPVCLACAASAYGFITGKRWGYWLGITLLLLNLTGDLINAALGIEPRAVAGVPIVALILWYLSRRQVRAFFQAATRGND